MPTTLEREKCGVIQASFARERLAPVYPQRPDLAIVEKGTPSSTLDPCETCRPIGEASNIPPIASVGEKKKADRPRSLEFGADDCLM